MLTVYICGCNFYHPSYVFVPDITFLLSAMSAGPVVLVSGDILLQVLTKLIMLMTS